MIVSDIIIVRNCDISPSTFFHCPSLQFLIVLFLFFSGVTKQDSRRDHSFFLETFCVVREDNKKNMAFAGTTQKCMACDKTVYLVDKLTADNRVYHKACFRCHHCKGTLKLSNYNSFEGVLYCRPHFDQIFKRTGSLEKSFEGTPKIAKPEKIIDNEKPAVAKASSMFGGTRDKCAGCQKTVYPTEKVTVNGTPYHKSCFKCCHGGCVISPSNYIAHEGKLYCKHHHIQLIKEKGNLSQLEGDNEKSAAIQGKINGDEVVAAETLIA